MKYLIISELNRNHFLFLSYFIIATIKMIVKRYITSTDDIIKTFHDYYIDSLSDFLSIIPLIIIKVRSKGLPRNDQIENEVKSIEKIHLTENASVSKSRAESSVNIEYIYSDINEKNYQRRIKRIIKLTIVVSIFEFLACYLNVTYNIITKSGNFIIKKIKINSIMLFNIFSKWALSVVILRLAIYKHHYLCFGINSVFLIGLVIYDILGIENNESYFYLFMKILKVILYSFEDVFAKILLSIDSISPYIYLFYRGICVNILALLYSVIFIFIKLPDENGVKSIVFTRFGKIYKNKLNILLYILLFFIEYVLNLNLYFIIDKFSPIHFAVASIMENFGSLLISIIRGEIGISEFFIKLAIYFILILAALVYNEFIILNFCGFQKHTKASLLKMANIEKNNSISISNNNNNDNDLFSEDEIDKNEIINNEENLNLNNDDESKENNLIEN